MGGALKYTRKYLVIWDLHSEIDRSSPALALLFRAVYVCVCVYTDTSSINHTDSAPGRKAKAEEKIIQNLWALGPTYA